MRTITGLVGRVNKSAYALNTPTATIGIRGTGGVIDVNPVTGATTLFGTSGTWDLRSQTGGSIPVSAGQTGRTLSSTQPAQQRPAPTRPLPAPRQRAEQAKPDTFQVSENRSATGQSDSFDSGGSAGGTAGIVAPMIGTGVAFTDVAMSSDTYSTSV